MTTITHKNDLLLGFDARVIEDSSTIIWDKKRRDDYLYRLDVLQPFSVDSEVWPSVAEYCGLVKPPYVGFYDFLWENLNQLNEFLCNNSTDVSHVSTCTIGVTLLTSICTQDELDMWHLFLSGFSPLQAQTEQNQVFPLTTPSVIDSSWFLLGFDVSDKYGVSALSNCRPTYDLENDEDLRNTWKAGLNKYHLFKDVTSANSYKSFSNSNILEHAPFFVYGVYKILANSDG